jgi:hypothetical protein
MEARAHGAAEHDSRPGFAAVLRIRAFSVLYAAETQSTVGDQLARVALSILVFRRTGSAAATALTYAATYLPAILGGVVLAGIGDRLPRRLVMIGCDVVRAALFATMAIPQLPIGLVVGLLAIAVFLGPAFSASEVSYLAAVLEPELFRVGTGLRMMSNQAAQVLGFAAGGVLVGTLGPRLTLVVDAATYLFSALLISTALRPAVGKWRSGGPTGRDAATPGFGGLWREPHIRALLALSALAGLFIVPEGLAVPFGTETGASPTGIGIMLAAIPLGGAIGAVVLVRLVPPHRRRAVAGLMAVGCGVPLVASGFADHWPIAAGCWLLSGVLAAYQVEAMTELVHLIPDAVRARLVGAASSVLLGAQGLGLVAFAGVAHYATPGHAIGLAGLLGSALAVVLVIGPLRRNAGADAGDRGVGSNTQRMSSPAG